MAVKIASIGWGDCRIPAKPSISVYRNGRIKITRLWKWLDRDISHLWKRYKAVVVISRRAGYTRMPA